MQCAMRQCSKPTPGTAAAYGPQRTALVNCATALRRRAASVRMRTQPSSVDEPSIESYLIPWEEYQALKTAKKPDVGPVALGYLGARWYGEAREDADLDELRALVDKKNTLEVKMGVATPGVDDVQLTHVVRLQRMEVADWLARVEGYHHNWEVTRCNEKGDRSECLAWGTDPCEREKDGPARAPSDSTISITSYKDASDRQGHCIVCHLTAGQTLVLRELLRQCVPVMFDFKAPEDSAARELELRLDHTPWATSSEEDDQDQESPLQLYRTGIE